MASRSRNLTLERVARTGALGGPVDGTEAEPTARQVRLAVELRRLRDAAGLTAREAATLLDVSAPQISQIESGLAGVSEKRLRRLVSNYSCTDDALIDAW